MHVARWVLATLVTASVVLAAVSARVHRSEGGALPPPSSGRLLPYDSTLHEAARPIATLTGAHLDQVIDVAAAGDTLFVLAARGWRVVAGRRVLGPFGAEDSGPEGLARARRIVVSDSGVFVLDIARRDVSRWTRGGRLRERVPIGAPRRPLVPVDLGVDAAGRPLVVAQEVTPAGSRWLILQLRRGREPAVIREAAVGASLFTQPRLATVRGEVVLLDPLTHVLTWLDSGRRVERVDAPVWSTPDSLRQRFAERAGRIRMPAARSLRLPDSLPSVQAFAAARNARLLTAVNPVSEHVLVEVFGADGTPLGRITRDPLPPPVFLTESGVVLVSEGLTATRFTLIPLAR